MGRDARRQSGSANVGVGGAEAHGLRIRGHGAARIQNLGPPRTGTEQTKSALSVRELADCGQQSSGLGHTTTQEIFAPLGSANGAEQLGGGARRDDSSFVEVDLKADPPESFDDCREEAPNGRGGSGTQPVVEEKGTQIDAASVGGFRCLTCFFDDRVDSECKKNRTQGVSLLNASYAGDDLRSDTVGAGEKSALVTVTTVDPGRD